MVSVRGDKQDVFSHGFICPKGPRAEAVARGPGSPDHAARGPDRGLVEVTSDEAFEEIDRRLPPLLAEHGPNSVAVCLGNPVAHSMSGLVYEPVFVRALGSRNVYSASTVDQMPKQVSAGLMFGTILSVPMPDVDRIAEEIETPGDDQVRALVSLGAAR